jgi:hypothetical protein
VIRLVLIAAALLVASWALLVVLARRLPPGAAKDLATVLPACATTARRLRKDPRVPRKARLAVGFAGLWAHVFAKLGVASWSELASLAARRGVADQA